MLSCCCAEEEDVDMQDAATSATPFAADAPSADNEPPRPKRSVSKLKTQFDTAKEEQAARQARATQEIARLQRISSSGQNGAPCICST